MCDIAKLSKPNIKKLLLNALKNVNSNVYTIVYTNVCTKHTNRLLD